MAGLPVAFAFVHGAIGHVHGAVGHFRGLFVHNVDRAVFGIRAWVGRQSGDGGENDEGEGDDSLGELHFGRVYVEMKDLGIFFVDFAGVMVN